MFLVGPPVIDKVSHYSHIHFVARWRPMPASLCIPILLYLDQNIVALSICCDILVSSSLVRHLNCLLLGVHNWPVDSNRDPVR